MESIPTDLTNWKDLARKQGVENVNIYNLENHVSASKIGAAQYLSLRSSWIAKDEKIVDAAEMGIRGLAEAEKWLNSRKDWTDYLKALKNPNAAVSVPELGTFSFSSFAQRQIARVREVDDKEKVDFTPMVQRLRSWDAKKEKSLEQEAETSPLARKGGSAAAGGLPFTPNKPISLADRMGDLALGDTPVVKSPAFSPWPMSIGLARELYPKVEDEQIVNYFLIGFLSSIVFHAKDIKSEWSPVRKAFNFGKGDNYLFQARTDGQLSLPGFSDQTKAQMIVEVKPTHRSVGNKVIHQATAQMAAWIFDEPDEVKDLKEYR